MYKENVRLFKKKLHLHLQNMVTLQKDGSTSYTDPSTWINEVKMFFKLTIFRHKYVSQYLYFSFLF